MKLNRTGSLWDRKQRNDINENWEIIEGDYKNIVDNVSEKAYQQAVDSAKLNWKEPVDNQNALPSISSEGDTRMVRNTGKVFRFNGNEWQEILQIDASPVNELDSRVSAQLTPIEAIKDFNVNATSPLLTPTYDNSYQAMHPKVLYFPNKWNDYWYWMAMTPYTWQNDKTENPSILVSHDGYHWFEPEGINNPISGLPEDAEGGHYSDTHIVMVGNTMELWYRYNPGGPGGVGNDNLTNYIYRQTSTDGINWTPKETIFHDSGSNTMAFMSPSIIYEDGLYKVWFNDYRWNMYYTESTDAQNWSPYQQISVPTPSGVRLWHADVIHTDKYEMVVSCNLQATGNYELYYTTSTDGINWQPAKRIITPTYGTDRLDNLQIYRASILKVDDMYKIYYSAKDTKKAWHTFLTQGKSIDTLQGYNEQNHNNTVIRRDLIMAINRRIQSGLSYILNQPNGWHIFSPNELEIATYGNGVKITKRGVGSISIDYDKILFNKEGELVSNDGRIRITKRGAGTSYIDYDGVYFTADKTGSSLKDGTLKLQKNGVGAVVAKFDDKSHTLTIKNSGDSASGFVEAGGIYFTGTYGGLQNVEGAMRYNKSSKKMELYNGTAWETIQSSVET